jgi:DNA-binding MarR family transcriptional regulator
MAIKDNLFVMQFGHQDNGETEFREVATNGRDWCNYGKDNKFPDYLLEMYDKSPLHGSIVRGKAMYVAGKGFEFKEKESKSFTESIPVINRHQESPNSILEKAALDLEIFNGFYLQLVWGKGGKITDIVHLDYVKVRSNADGTKFYYKADGNWAKGKPEPFDAFDISQRTGTQILYYKTYRPKLNVYTLPEYLRCESYVQSDILVAGHTLNNAKSGFTATKMVVFTDGEPSEEEKKEIEKKFQKKASGEAGVKILIAFAANAQVAPEVVDLGQSDLSKENFEKVDQLISQNIYRGHQITSPILFGERTEGQLGGRTEMREAYEILKNTYINFKQQTLEEVFNKLFEINGIPKVSIVPVEPIAFEFSEAIVSANMTKDEIREKAGLPPMEVEVKTESQKIIDAINSLSPLVANKVLEAMSEDELRSLVGLNVKKKVEPTETTKPIEEEFSSQEDDTAIEIFAQYGEPREDYFRMRGKKVAYKDDFEFGFDDESAQDLAFAEMTQREADVIDLIKKDKRITPSVIAKVLDIDVNVARRILASLEAKDLVKSKVEKIGGDEQIVRQISEGGKVAKKERKATTTEVFVKYSYTGPKDDRNRDFCRKMLDLDKLYSRGEIEQISQRLGYSVWERRGGFYHNPKTGKTTPYCRHYWSQEIVIKKK